jgi:tetratricopeptide (TPR) repeat protein
MTLLQLNKDSQGAKQIAISMIEYMKQNRNTIGRKARFGIWFGYLAEFEIEDGNYESALKYLYKGREYFSGSALNLALSKKLEVDCYFLKGDYSKAKEVANNLTSVDLQITGDFRRDMMLYYIGCCHFMLDEFREAARMFNLKFELTHDKLGWEVNIRFMRIMTMIELERIDEAHAMVVTVGKHIERYKQSKDLAERDLLLLKLFRELSKEGFAFDRPGEKVYHYLLQLSESGKDHSWQALTPELIPIHKWVIKKYQRFLPPVEKTLRSEKTYKTAARKKMH